MSIQRICQLMMLLGRAGVMLLGCTLCGCGRTPEPGGQVVESPRDAYLVLLGGMKDADTARILAVTHATDEQKQAIEVGVEYTRAMHAFRDALIKAYGREGWEQFQDPHRRPGDYDAYFALIEDAEIARARTMTVNQGDKDANCAMPNGVGKVRMLKTDKGWQIDGAMFLPDGAPAADVITKVKGLTEAIRKYQKAIGKPDITVGDIDAELGRAMDEILVNRKVDVPRRFDINKIAG